MLSTLLEPAIRAWSSAAAADLMGGPPGVAGQHAVHAPMWVPGSGLATRAESMFDARLARP